MGNSFSGDIGNRNGFWPTGKAINAGQNITESGSGPTMSICTWLNLASGVAKVAGGVLVCL